MRGWDEHDAPIDRTKARLECPQGDLIIFLTVSPASDADHLIETLTEGHLQQVAEEEGRHLCAGCVDVGLCECGDRDD